MNSFRLPHLSRAALSLIVLATSASLALAQGTPDDYARSASLSKRIENKTFRQSVNARWLEGGQKFWYRIDTAPNRFEFILVDAVAGTRKPAFDHQKLAVALGRELKTAVDAGALPFSSIEPAPTGAWVRFRADGKVWQFNRDGVLQKSNAALSEEKLAPLRRERPSSASAQPSAITFINRLKVPLSLFWIDTTGQAQAYGTLKPGEILRRTTFSGHVWRVDNAQGQVLGIYRASDDESQAILEDAEAEKPKA
ncbi:MAG TPA: hypothetical protein VF627_01010, partial [Abditibacterium sp.]